MQLTRSPQASTCDDMLRRIKDFVKPHRMYAALELFGPNVGSVNGDIWARHRRITSPPFNERVSGSVWRESVAQAGGMLDSWLGRARKSGPQGDEGVANLVGDTMLLALHVLTAAGFGKRFEFEGGVQAVSKGHVMSYRDALRTVLQNMYGVIILLSFFMWLPEWMMTANLLMIKTSTQEFRSYMSEMVEEERAGVRLKMEGNDNLMSVLLRASDVEKEGKGRSGLSDEEIYGNLFVYNLAGHDTTANTLAYAITLLATDPKWQEWVGEEITAVFGGKENVEDLEYTEAFPKLKRCMALMVSVLPSPKLLADDLSSTKPSASTAPCSGSPDPPRPPSTSPSVAKTTLSRPAHTCPSIRALYTPTLHTGVPTAKSGDQTASSIQTTSLFPLIQAVSFLGFRDRVFALGRNSRRWSS
jgi:hypothetical protein